ncbi:MAG: hypothetical protein IKA76_06385 [Clostridia bacterium]|nr:hypothetical protein [Clostridia bacterium]
MNKLLEAFNSGTVEQQARRRKGMLIIAATSALLILATLVLIVGLIVSLAAGDSDPNGDPTIQDDTHYVKGSFDPDYLVEGNLLLLDDDHPYEGDADVVKFSNHSSRPKNEERKNIYTLRDSSNFGGTEETVIALHALIKGYYDQSDNDDNLIVDQAFASNLSEQIDPIFSMGTTVSLTYYADYSEDKDPTEEPSIQGVAKYKWIYDHAHEYGFIIVEDNIFRYVGIPHAAYMKQNNLSLTQYLDKLRSTSYEKSLVITAENETYRTYYISETAEDKMVPADLDWTVSGDNLGGYIITFKPE